MIDIIEQIEILNRSIGWVIAHPYGFDGRCFLELCELRHKFNKLAEAESGMPTIATFGECQSGKSMVVDHLLGSQKNPFRVKDENGNMVLFGENISPIGGVAVTASQLMRFSSFRESERMIRYWPEHPVTVKLLSIADMAILLAQAYYSCLDDFRDYDYAEDEMKTLTDQIFEKYSNMSECTQDILIEDDIIGIKNYLEKYVTDTQSLQRSGFFERLALIIRRVPQSEWVDVLQYLWHGNEAINTLFRRLINSMSRLGFAREVYVDFDAVLNLGDRRNTILCKECLGGLFDTSMSSATTNVHVLKNDKLEIVPGFPKCYLSAVCAEVVFKIEPEYLDDEACFFFDNNLCDKPGQMPLQTKMKLPDKVRKDLLVNTDLLDFPEVHSRLKVPNNALGNGCVLSHVFLHCKITFLFNNYNENHFMDILLFCHDNEQPNVNEMYRMINDWVDNNVGNSVRIREQTISCCGGVSPLFVVGTRFHNDMMEKHWNGDDLDMVLHHRWVHRFAKVLFGECFRADTVEWFRNWYTEGNTFKNTYLLRDYHYSGCNGLFGGYDGRSPHPKETELFLTSEFYYRLRETFVSDSFVQMFFEDPALAWDVVATINNNGVLYLIEKLSLVAKNIGKAREKQIVEKSCRLQQQLDAIMEAFLDRTSVTFSDFCHKQTKDR